MHFLDDVTFMTGISGISCQLRTFPFVHYKNAFNRYENIRDFKKTYQQKKDIRPQEFDVLIEEKRWQNVILFISDAMYSILFLLEFLRQRLLTNSLPVESHEYFWICFLSCDLSHGSAWIFYFFVTKIYWMTIVCLSLHCFALWVRLPCFDPMVL